MKDSYNLILIYLVKHGPYPTVTTLFTNISIFHSLQTFSLPRHFHSPRHLQSPSPFHSPQTFPPPSLVADWLFGATSCRQGKEAEIGQTLAEDKPNKCYRVIFETHTSHFWSERSACDQRSNLGRPLFLVLFHVFFLGVPLFKSPEGVVVGFWNFAWAPK